MRDGNRCPDAAPHGIYLCQRDDRWCAIAVSSQEEWQSFCKTIGNPPWTQESRFTTLAGRKENEDELNKLVDKWTRIKTAEKVMSMMQEAGVLAGVVQNPEDLHYDTQLKLCNHYQLLEHPIIGKHYYFTTGFKLSKTP